VAEVSHPAYETILVETRDSVCRITLNRPEKRNAMNERMLRELAGALGRCEEDERVRVCVLRGAGEKAFSAGADLSEIASSGPLEIRESNRLWIDVFKTIEAMGKPVIASVHGHALAGGTELTLCCDLVVASDDALFGLTEMRVGVIPGAGACVRLPRWVGRAKAKEILMTGDPIPADEAYRIGLVNRVVPRAGLERATDELAAKLAARSPTALKAAKRAVNIGGEMDLDRGIEYVLQEFALLFAGSDQKEGMSAFLEKREPKFTGS
jgi:enoyl-CoA hydratase/carnithine racemase